MTAKKFKYMWDDGVMRTQVPPQTFRELNKSRKMGAKKYLAQNKGWVGESTRHSMASYGIKTGRTKSGIVMVGKPKQINAVLKLEKKIQKSKITPMPKGCNVWDVEGYVITRKQELQIWQHLVDTGQAWSLQGWYGRTAQALLDAGEIKYPKHKTHDYYGNPIRTRD
jgi:hypothetical protein